MELLPAIDALTRLGGVASTHAVLTLTSRSRLRAALSRSEVVRISRGRLALAVVDASERAVQVAGGHLSHLSAALHHGWTVKDMPDLPQLVLPPGVRPPDGWDGFVAEVRHRDLRAREKAGWATSPLRTVLDCSTDLPFDEALCVADSALRARAISAEQFRAAAGPRQRRVATYADGCAANPFESALRAICIEIGLEVVPQYEITCGNLTFHPDLANLLLGLVIEADSYTFHGMDKKAHARDVVRYNALTVAGWTVLRFTWEQVMLNPGYVKGALLAWLARPEPGGK